MYEYSDCEGEGEIKLKMIRKPLSKEDESGNDLEKWRNNE